MYMAQGICRRCGNLFNKRSNAQKYCKDCKNPRSVKKSKDHLTIDEIISKMKNENFKGTYGQYISEGRDKL